MDQHRKGTDVIVGKNVKEKRNIRKFLPLVLVGIVLLFIFSFALKRYVYVASCTSNPRDPLYKEAAAVMDAQKTDELKKVVDKIQKVKTHESDPNCLYPIAKYYVNIQSSEKAEVYYEKIKRTSKEGGEFNAVYHKYGDKNLSNLRLRLDLLKNNNGNDGSSTVFL